MTTRERQQLQQRLTNLMTSNPVTTEQRQRKDDLIQSLRIQLGILRPENPAAVVHSIPRS
jgi:hypothetical protein